MSVCTSTYLEVVVANPSDGPTHCSPRRFSTSTVSACFSSSKRSLYCENVLAVCCQKKEKTRMGSVASTALLCLWPERKCGKERRGGMGGSLVNNTFIFHHESKTSTGESIHVAGCL